MSRRYPWETWFKQKKFTLVKGRDFQCLTQSMMVQTRIFATSRGVKVHIEQSDNAIDVVVENPMKKGKRNAKTSR